MNAAQILAHPDQSLVKHLLGVARRAKEFAARFEGENQAELAGLLHDLGKAEKEFQDRIAGKKADKHPHAHHGAALALAQQVWPVAFAINGHHAGLHDRSDLQQVASRWMRPAHACEGALSGDGEWSAQTWPVVEFGNTLPAWLEEISFGTASERDAKMRAVDFYTRMIFSALVDADRLDTEDANLAVGSQANVLKRKAWRFAAKGLAASGAVESLLQMLEDMQQAQGAGGPLKKKRQRSESQKDAAAAEPTRRCAALRPLPLLITCQAPCSVWRSCAHFKPHARP